MHLFFCRIVKNTKSFFFPSLILIFDVFFTTPFKKVYSKSLEMHL